MPDYKDIDKELNELALDIERAADDISDSAGTLQSKITKLLKEEILKFEIANDKFVKTQDFKKRILLIEGRITDLFGTKSYQSSISKYLSTFSTIEDRNIAMQKTYNELEVDVKKLSPARKYVLEQSNYYLKGAGFRDSFIQPAKFLLMQQVTTGMSMKDSIEMLGRWGNGDLTTGAGTMGRQTPDLQTYVSQIAHDTAFQYNGTINNIIKEEYGLEQFIYSGGLVAGSRPLCVHLVNLRRPISFSELPAILKRYPQGLVKGTDKENFPIYRGGYRCAHLTFAVRKSK